MAKPRPIFPMPEEERAHLRDGRRKNLLRAIHGAPYIRIPANALFIFKIY
jgi:hypothetical protein